MSYSQDELLNGVAGQPTPEVSTSALLRNIVRMLHDAQAKGDKASMDSAIAMISASASEASAAVARNPNEPVAVKKSATASIDVNHHPASPGPENLTYTPDVPKKTAVTPIPAQPIGGQAFPANTATPA